MEKRYLYVVFSSTPYRIGKIIRAMIRQPYNHVSIALDEQLAQMYSFARRYYSAPLYGGFVHETPDRYCIGHRSSRIKVCRLQITDAQYQAVSQRIARMYANKEHFLYNHLSVLGMPFQKRIPVKDAFICIEFVVSVLASVGFPLDQRKYCSIGRLESILQPYTVYTGIFQRKTSQRTAYFEKLPLSFATYATARDFGALFLRLVKK